jgi:hypothetical protein
MGADKNSSPKRELGLYPKFTTTDSHTSLPRSRSHNGSTNPRNKPQTIAKRKHETRSKGLSCPEQPWRTVHVPGADSPQSPCGRSATHSGFSVKHDQNDPTGTSTRGRSVPRPRTVREKLVPREQSVTSGRTVRQTPYHQKPMAIRIKTKALKNTQRTRRTPGPKDSTPTVRTRHADSPRGANRRGSSSPRANSTTPYHLSFHGSPKWLKPLRKDLRKMLSVPRGYYAPKLKSSNNLNRRELNRHRNQPKT